MCLINFFKKNWFFFFFLGFVSDRVFDHSNAYVAFLNVNLKFFLLIFYWPHEL